MRTERVIRNGRVVADPWTYWGLDEAGLAQPLPQGPVLVPLAFWREHRETLLARGTPVGVWLAPADEPATLAGDLEALPLIAVHYPKFTDGRGHTTAVLLRTRLGYRGELRAFGDVGRDHLFYLRRCGFDAFALAPHRDPEAALASLEDFSVCYQGSAEDPRPLFRYREAARHG
jgi:uncharacterized protein (DUF934 family)